jgi:ParB family chromosome partitioning protein
MALKKGLGRGFDSLIPTELLDESFDPTAAQDGQVSDLRNIKVSEIEADPDQPRRRFDEVALQDLAQSIRIHGILQPIVVTSKGGKYMIVAGERRWRAAQIAGLDKIPALVRTLTNQHRLELSLIENLQRTDLNPLETATAYVKLRDQFNLSLDQVSERVGGKSQSAISNTMRLLRLPDFARKEIAEGNLTEGQARPLINLDPELIKQVLPRILKEGWSARTIEQYVVQLKKTDQIKAKYVEKITNKAYEAEVERLHKRFKLPVKVNTSAKGSGVVTIKFKNDEEFKRLLDLLEK